MSKLLFVGDICTDSYKPDDIEKLKNTYLYEFLSSYDGTIVGNLEAPLLEKTIINNKNKFSLLNKPSFFEMYNFCSAFTIANNHIFDQELEGLNKTKIFLDSHGKGYFGAGNDIKEARKSFILNVNDKKIYFLGYDCYSTNSEYNAKSSSYGSSPLVFEYIEQDIKKAQKDGADFIFILPHWGIENEFYPTSEQVGFARRIIDLGVDGIIGSHTHTIQAFETYKDKPIYYSLGNFLFNHFQISKTETYFQHKYNKEGMIAEIVIDENGLTFKEYFLQMDDAMIPEFCEVNNLETKISSINQTLKEKTKNIKHTDMNPNLSISLKFNGKSMQLVYDDKPLDKNLSIKYEKFKTRIKRVVMKKIKSFV